jgi:cell division protein FtsW
MLVIWRILKLVEELIIKFIIFLRQELLLMIIIAFLITGYGISGMIPIKGIAVPFLSYGGSSLITMAHLL